MAKHYVILCNEDIIVFPIKAAENPYTGKAAYCAGAPQFFGGADEGKCRLTTLQREVGEESAETYQLNSFVGIPIFEDSYDRTAGVGAKSRRLTVETKFFYSVDWTLKSSDWPSREKWSKLPKKNREMCFVATVDRQKIQDAIGRNKFVGPLIIYEAFMEAASRRAPDWVKKQFKMASTEEFMKSNTREALVLFVADWLDRKLKGWPRSKFAISHQTTGFP